MKSAIKILKKSNSVASIRLKPEDLSTKFDAPSSQKLTLKKNASLKLNRPKDKPCANIQTPSDQL